MSRTPGTPRLLRAINDRAALSLLLEQGPLSRVQLGALTGLSKPTASQLLSRLEEAGLVVQVGTSAGGRGPNAALYAVNASAAYVAGVDVVPERVTVAVADITGTVVAQTAVETEPGSDADPTPDVRAALASATRKAGIRVRDLRGLVIGSPGVHDPATDALNYADALPGWSRPGIVAELRKRLGIPVELENDVNLAAIAERQHGRVADVGSFALLWVSDGLGLAIDLGGALHRGATGGAGEIGYMPVPTRPGHPEPAGAPIIDFQDLVGAPAVLQLAREHGLASGAAAATPVDGAAVSQAKPTAEATAKAEAAAEAEATAEAETAAEKAKSAPAGDAAAIKPAAEAVRRASEGATGGDAFLGELASRLATGLATIVAVLDPELVVLTGEICRAGGEALAARVQRLLHEGSPLRPSVLPSAIDGNPVLIGALDQALGVAREEVFGAGDLSQLHRTPSPTPRTTARSEL